MKTKIMIVLLLTLVTLKIKTAAAADFNEDEAKEVKEVKALIEKEKWQNDADVKIFYQQINKFLS